MNLYLFDVDDTLEISKGPIPISRLTELKRDGHIIGICGNWALFVKSVTGWQNLVSMLGPMLMSKHDFMTQIATYIKADHYIMVGNVPADSEEARLAGWEFVKEDQSLSMTRCPKCNTPLIEILVFIRKEQLLPGYNYRPDGTDLIMKDGVLGKDIGEMFCEKCHSSYPITDTKKPNQKVKK